MADNSLYEDCDKILMLMESQNGRIQRSDGYSVVEKGNNRLHNALQQLLADGAIKEYPAYSKYYDLLQLGRKILSLGGYIKYLETLSQKEIEQIEIASLTKQKLNIDLKNAQRVYKTYWWTFGIALAGFIISLILLLFKFFGKTS
jgi:hypothetical protein